MTNSYQSFQNTFRKKIRPAMQKKYNYSTVMAVPRITKLVINVGIGEAVTDKKHIDYAIEEFTQISGQKPIVCPARKSVSGFKLREKMPIGIKLTLRGHRMYEFIFRLIHVVFPRILDFRGLSSSSFDEKGNYNLGLREQIVFPEIDYDKIKLNKGMNITLVIPQSDQKKSLELLRELGFPMRS